MLIFHKTNNQTGGNMPSEKLKVKEQLERQFLDHLRDDFPETGPEADIKL